ncbi:MAG: flagellar protein FlbB [Spirochaetales bacterium]|nr:flagellar protein FlbB [Spirochaetales bacterium]MCF7937612.1 flagellar protein FlbB [Spirochaetales bacterium]
MAVRSAFLRILLMLLLVIALAGGGALLLDYLGFIDVKDQAAPVLELVGIDTRTQVEDTAEPLLLERERVKKQEEAIDRRLDELEEREAALDEREDELLQLRQKLEEREASLAEREKSFNERVKQYDNKRANIVQNAQYLGGMPPENAVEIMNNMAVQDVVAVLRESERLAREAGEQSVVAFWLSLMKPDRAAQIQRRMAETPQR